MPILDPFGRFCEASLVFGFRTISILSRPFRRPARGLRSVFRRAYWKYKLKGLGDRSRIYPRVVIHSPENVGVGDHVEIAEFVHIWGNGGVDIGDFSIIGAHSIITTLTHDKDSPVYNQSLVMKSVRIGRNVWIGTGSILLPGITIGDGAIIGAGSIVSRDVKPATVVVGFPASVLFKLEKKGEGTP